MIDDMLVVDLGGVAARYLPKRRLTALQHATGLDAESLQCELFDSGLDSRAERGDFTTDQLVEQILVRLNYRIDVDDLVVAWSQCFAPANTVLNALDEHPGPKALFTNNGPMIDLCLTGPLSDIADRFDTIICSWHIGVVKPEATAFERAAARLERQPCSLLLLDDSPPNVTAARLAGWRAAHATADDDLAVAIGSAR